MESTIIVEVFSVLTTLQQVKKTKVANISHQHSNTAAIQHLCKMELINSVYILTCGNCKLQYLGESEILLNIRLNNHQLFYTIHTNEKDAQEII